MSIYLVQHALALTHEEDPERGISETGRAETLRIAEVAKGYRVNVSQIQHSGKKRARETAEIFARELEPGSGIDAVDGLNPMDDIQPVAVSLDPTSNLMMVGHLPHLERLASWITTGQEDHAVFRFQNSGIVCLDRSEDSDLWHIKWTLMPKIG